MTIITRRRDSDGHTPLSFLLAAELSSPLRTSPKFDRHEETSVGLTQTPRHTLRRLNRT